MASNRADTRDSGTELRGWIMAMNDEEVRLIPSGGEGPAQRIHEGPNDLFAAVRSTVESQFRQMEQAHDRIRAEALAARLGDQTVN